MDQKLLRERKPGSVLNLISVFLFLLLVFVPCLLYALKKDLGLAELKNIYVPAALAVLALRLIFMLVGIIRGKIGFLAPSLNKKDPFLWVFLGAAVLLGVFSFFCVTPSFVNDDTWEAVETTLLHGSVYEYSSLTGMQLETGHPIFYKVYIMPMFYAVIRSFLNVGLYPIAGIVIPVFVYILHLWLVYEISAEVLPEKVRFLFMTVYLAVLCAGTYLPKSGVPVTAGYAVLREGYSGYGICYGLVLPMCLLCVLQRRWIRALFAAASAMGLLRLDRIFYGLIDVVKTNVSVNGAGKLFFLFIVCVAALILCGRKSDIRPKWYACLIPSVTIALTTVSLGSLLKTRRDTVIYYLGIGAVIFACCDFKPFDDAEFGNFLSTHRGVAECTQLIPEGSVVLSTKEFMEKVRRVDSKVKTAFARSYYTPELTGLDFEEPPKYCREYLMFAENYSMWISAYGYTSDSGYISLYELAEMIGAGGIDTIVIPVSRNDSEESDSFTDAGFEYLGDRGGYSVYHLYGG